MVKKSEEMQSIYRWHNPKIITEFGTRSMTEIGVIKGLEIEDTANYMLVPFKKSGEDATSWCVHRIPTETDVEPLSWDSLDEKYDGEP